MSVKAKQVALLSALLWLASFGAVYAASYFNEAVQALQSSNVYVSGEASVSTATQQEIEQQVQGSQVAVAILPPAAAIETSDLNQFASRVVESTGRNIVVVAIGDELGAGSSLLPPGRAEELADKAEAENTSAGDAVLDFIAEVKNSQPQASSPQNASESGGGGSIVLVAAFLVVVTFGMLAILLWRNSKPTRSSPESPKAPGPIEELLAEIERIKPGIKDRQILSKIAEGERHTKQLFARLKQAGSTQIEEVTARYKGLLQLVRNTLVQYQDIQDHPEYYQPRTQQYLESGREAVEQYAAGVLRNVREVAQGTLTDFRVNVKILAASNPAEDPKI